MVVGGRELIDTLWNVNQFQNPAYLLHLFRINRYIMECKYQMKWVGLVNNCELIDTLWNVNS